MNTAFKEYFTHNNIIIALTTIKDTKEYYHFITCNTSLPTTYIYDMANNIINNRPLYSQSTMQPQIKYLKENSQYIIIFLNAIANVMMTFQKYIKCIITIYMIHI